MARILTLALMCLILSAVSCDRAQTQDNKAPETPKTDARNTNGGDHGSHGPAVELGSTRIGDLDVRAARDAGELKPGGDAPIDVWLTGGTAKVASVRFWIGSADAKGSVKAKAEIEDPAQPNHWHTHVEIPEPFAAESKLWVEIEPVGAAAASGSFDLKR